MRVVCDVSGALGPNELYPTQRSTTARKLGERGNAPSAGVRTRNTAASRDGNKPFDDQAS